MAEEMNISMESPEIPQEMEAMPMAEMPTAPQEEAQSPGFDMNAIIDGGPKQNYAVPLQDKPTAAGSSAPSDFSKEMSKMVDESTNYTFRDKYAPKTFEEKINPVVGPGVRYADDDINLYRYQDDFNPEGFDPFNPKNYQHWTEKETWSSALGKGMDSFATRFGNTYTDSFASYGRMFDALVNWDWDKVRLSEPEMVEENWAEYKESMKNFVFIDPKEEGDIISKRSVSEFLGNAGFAMGTVGALGTELVADALLTYATGGAGAGSFAATISKFTGLQGIKAAAREGFKTSALKGMAKVGDFVSDVGKGAYQFANQSTDAITAAGRVANQAEQAATIARGANVGSDALRASMKEVFDTYTLNLRNIVKSRTFADLGMNIAKGTPLVGTGIRYGEKVVAGAKAGLSTGKLVGIGLQGARRLAQEFNMSSTEAGFEAVTSYGSTLDLMIKNYQSENEGENPSSDELVKMKDKALQASASNYNTNLALLLVTNRLQFGSAFNRFAGATKWGRQFLEQGAEKAFAVNRVFKSSALKGQVYQKGFFGTYGLTGKIAKDFGKKQAVYEFGKQFMKDALKFEVSEGLQENLQETSASAWMNYYAGQYNGTKYTLGQAFNKGLDEQFTKQGLRTFLQGALTGSLIRPATSLSTKASELINERATAQQYKDNPQENPYVRMREQLKKDIDLQNQFYNQVSNSKLGDNVVHFTAQMDSTLAQTDAAARGDNYEWQNGKDNSVLAGALAANRTGTISAYKQAMRELGETIPDDEFEASFGTKLADTKYATAAEFTKQLAKDLGQYSDTIDSIRKKVKSMPDPLMYEKGSKDQLVATIMNYAQEEAIKIIALNTLKGQRASERAKSLAEKLMKIPGLTQNSEYALRVLANPDNFKAEIGNIEAEIKLLQEGLQVADPILKDSLTEKINIKKEKLKLLDKWFDFWTSEEVEESRTDVKTGEQVTQKSKQFRRFKGVEMPGEIQDEDGNVIEKDGILYSLDHPEIRETFKKFINLTNQELGINEELSEQSTFDGIDSIVDFIRLDQDAKDYMSSVDLLYNREYYKQTIGRIQDGRFKYELLEFVESLNDRLRGAIMYAVGTNMTDGTQQEKFQKVLEVYNKLTEELKKNEAYKNLVAIVVSENLGIDSSKFAQENLKILNDFLQAKIADIFDQYGAPAMTEDVSEEDFNKFLKNPQDVSGFTKNQIARKIKAGKSLSSREGQIYDAHRDDIINIKKYQDEVIDKTAEEISRTNLARKDLMDDIKQRLVDTGKFTIENLDALDQSQIYDTAFEEGLITADDLSFGSTSVDVITDDVFKEFETTGFVPQEILMSIAYKDQIGLNLSLREEKILEAKAEEILKMQDENDAEEEEETPDVPVDEDEDEEAPTQPGPTPPAGPTPGTPGGETGTPGLGADTDTLTNFFGFSDTESTVTGNDTDGFDVVTENGTKVNSEKIVTEEDANDIKEELDISKINNAWAEEFFKGEGVDFAKLTSFITSVNRSLAAFAKDNPTVKTFKDYYATSFGKQKIDNIKESKITGKPLSQIEKEKKVVVKATGTPVDLFDTPSSITNGPAVTMDSMQALHEELIKTLEGVSKTSEENPSPIEMSDIIRLAIFFAENPKEPTVSGSVVVKFPNTYNLALDIEKRRRNDLNSIKEYAGDDKTKGSFVTYNGYTLNGKRFEDSSPDAVLVENGFNADTRKQATDLINAKYDAEQDALKKAKSSTTNVSETKEAREKKSLGGLYGKILPNFLDEDGTYSGTYYSPTGTQEQVVGISKKDVSDKIKAKYEQEVSQKIDTFVEKGEISEQSILDQLDDLHSCF